MVSHLTLPYSVSFALSIMLISVINKAQRKQHLENFLCQHLHLVTVEKAMSIILEFCWSCFAPPLYQSPNILPQGRVHVVLQ